MNPESILESFTNKITSFLGMNSTSGTILDIKLAIALITIACFLSALALVALTISHIRLKRKFQAKVEGSHPATIQHQPSQNPHQTP